MNELRYCEKIWDKMKFVYDLLEDDLSENIFERKIRWMLGGKDETAELLYETYNNSRIIDLERTYGKNVRYAVAGAGKYGEQTYRALTHAGFQVACFLDNDTKKQGKKKLGVPILSFADLRLMKEDIIVILDNIRLQNMFYHELMEIGYSSNKIYLSLQNIVRTAFGNIYYDLPQLRHQEDEVFLDCGGFDGESTREFIRWCDGRYEKIYVIEPMAEGIALMNSNLADVDHVTMIQCALGNHDGEACFSQSYGAMKGSRLGTGGDNIFSVPLRSIDSILKGEKATFIKMDIEGAELPALQGAENTLRKYKPKLAISLYHKNEDIIEIPIWIKSVVPEYKFYIRHYSNKRWDLVLYCVTECS